MERRLRNAFNFRCVGGAFSRVDHVLQLQCQNLHAWLLVLWQKLTCMPEYIKLFTLCAVHCSQLWTAAEILYRLMAPHHQQHSSHNSVNRSVCPSQNRLRRSFSLFPKSKIVSTRVCSSLSRCIFTKSQVYIVELQAQFHWPVSCESHSPVRLHAYFFHKWIITEWW